MGPKPRYLSPKEVEPEKKTSGGRVHGSPEGATKGGQNPSWGWGGGGATGEPFTPLATDDPVGVS